MKIFIFILLVICGLWLGYQYYPASQNIPSLDNKTEASQMTKCITSSGEVIYGKVPVGTICQRTEAVKGALTIVPGQKESKSENKQITSKISIASKCDERTHCSQMTSCEEATYFLNNCPNTEMDGNKDGTPCEKQWCN